MLDEILEHSYRVNIFDVLVGFTDSKGNYFGRYTIEVDPYGPNEIRCHADNLDVLFEKALAALKERDKGL